MRALRLDDLDDDALADLYAYPAESASRPWVRSTFITTLDGAAQGPDGVSGSLGDADDRRVFALLRSLCDVVLVGSGTARAEGYRPVGADEVDGALRARLGLAPTPPVAVVSATLDVPDALVAPGQLIITRADADPRRLAMLRENVDVVAVGEGAVDWPAALEALAGRGLRRILCEGGPRLHGTLVASDLVDELCLSIAPYLTAGDAPRIAASTHPVLHAMRLEHAVAGTELLLTRSTRRRT